MAENNLIKLQNFIIDHFSLDEIRALCFVLYIEYENLGGSETRRAKARQLILASGERGKLEQLLQEIEKERENGFARLGLSTSPQSVEWYYKQLQEFENATKPLSEKIAEKFRIETRLAFIILALLIILSGAVLIYTLRPKTPQRMSGDFRIAVTGFTQTGGEVDGAIIRDLTESIYLQIDKSFKGLDIPFTVQVWGPELAGSIDEPDPKKRAETAEKIAAGIGADVVVYGVVDTHDQVWKVTPEFYVSDRNLSDAHEITGQHQLGMPFIALGDSQFARRLEVSRKMTSRAGLLSQITIGLAHYASQNNREALTIFQSLENDESWEDIGGKAMLYVLISSAAGQLDDINLAEKSFDDALSEDPEYARAYVGLGFIYYLKALQSAQSSDNLSQIDDEQLQRSIDMLEAARKAKNKPELSDISTKIHYVLGLVYLAQSLADESVLTTLAIQEFEAVLADFDDGKNPRVREMAAESHARLGLIYALSESLEPAADHYEEAASLLFDHVEQQQLYEKRAAELRTKQVSS